MEKHNPELAQRAALAPPPAGPQARRASPHVLHCYVIWSFSPQVELAKRFLVDLAAAAEAAFQASEFYNLPCFTRAMPDLMRKLNPGGKAPVRKAAAGPTPAGPADRYAVLADADRWSAWPGYPGPYSPAIDETLQRSVIPSMFARAARGDLSAEESVRTAEVEMRRIFSRWTK
jgi:multiple sugar transport system substrate-binding protein